MAEKNFIADLTGRVVVRSKREFLKMWYRPRLNVSAHGYKLVRLGTRYGGWTFADLPALQSSTVISCGLGEDASFDVEFASKYGAQVAILDPTPRAVAHFTEISSKVGHKATAPHTNTGKQPVASYDLSRLNDSSLKLLPKALWRENRTLRFYSPPDKGHVSHSISNFQNGYRTDTDSIEVPAVTISEVLSIFKLSRVALMKLDIEGAEIEVLQDMMEKKVYPDQLLIEYDELNFPSSQAKSRIEACHATLLENGYRLINFDKPSNFLYMRT